MSSLDRIISGEALVRHLPRDEQTIDQSIVARHGRSARTLVKEGLLRLTIMALAPDGDLPAHKTDGPVSIHVLEGEVVFEALGQKYPLSVGDLLVLAAGVEHSASSVPGCVFLLTVVHTPSAGSRSAG
jgi:quercetin dioxygenase-like cupin family protein